MNMEMNVRQAGRYVSRYWFRIGMVAVVIMLLAQKDFSFNIRVGGEPEPVERPARKQAAPVEERRETLTDATAGTSIVDRLDFFSGGSSEAEKAALYRGLQSVDRKLVDEFIRRFSHVAQTEQQKFGIPASIIMANGLLHSQGGQLRSTGETNNFFALPCTDDWQGPTGQHGGECLREYDNAWTSFRDHSLYVTTGAFSRLAKLGASDHKAWAEGLEKAGYAGTPALAAQLQAVIRQYELTRLD